MSQKKIRCRAVHTIIAVIVCKAYYLQAKEREDEASRMKEELMEEERLAQGQQEAIRQRLKKQYGEISGLQDNLQREHELIQQQKKKMVAEEEALKTKIADNAALKDRCAQLEKDKNLLEKEKATLLRTMKADMQALADSVQREEAYKEGILKSQDAKLNLLRNLSTDSVRIAKETRDRYDRQKKILYKQAEFLSKLSIAAEAEADEDGDEVSELQQYAKMKEGRIGGPFTGNLESRDAWLEENFGSTPKKGRIATKNGRQLLRIGISAADLKSLQEHQRMWEKEEGLAKSDRRLVSDRLAALQAIVKGEEETAAAEKEEKSADAVKKKNLMHQRSQLMYGEQAFPSDGTAAGAATTTHAGAQGTMLGGVVVGGVGEGVFGNMVQGHQVMYGSPNGPYPAMIPVAAGPVPGTTYAVQGAVPMSAPVGHGNMGMGGGLGHWYHDEAPAPHDDWHGPCGSFCSVTEQCPKRPQCALQPSDRRVYHSNAHARPTGSQLLPDAHE